MCCARRELDPGSINAEVCCARRELDPGSINAEVHKASAAAAPSAPSSPSPFACGLGSQWCKNPSCKGVNWGRRERASARGGLNVNSVVICGVQRWGGTSKPESDSSGFGPMGGGRKPKDI